MRLVDTKAAAKTADMSVRTFTRYARDNNIKGKRIRSNWFKWTALQIEQVRQHWIAAGARKRKNYVKK